MVDDACDRAAAIARTGVQARQIAALGITNQRETTIVWERATGRPIHNAIVWQDRRTADACAALRAGGHEAAITARTGLVVDPYFSATKIGWLLDHVEGARGAAQDGRLAFGTVDSFLLWRLTGGKRHVTDVSNASRTMLMDLQTLQWDDELLALLDVPLAILPEIRSSSEVYGETLAEHFGAPIPIAGCAGDQQAATFGQACFHVGSAKNTYGTGCFMLLNVGPEPVPSTNRLLTTVGWQIAGNTTFCLEGSVFVGGAVVQWLRDGLHAITTSADVEALAATVSDSGGVVFVPAFVGLGAPHWDQYARGAMFGLTRGTSLGHIARAALESMAFQSADVLRAMEQDAGSRLQTLKVDGGASMNNSLMQFQADILNVKIARPVVAETTALGAAYLAGLAVGFWSDIDDVERNWSVGREFNPSMADGERVERQRVWERAVQRSLGWEG